MKGKLILLLLGLLALALVALTLPYPAHAQAYQCRLPERIEPYKAPEPGGPARRSPISGYTLAASWSPAFCRDDNATMQCSGRNGRFGFILHGLWPESSNGPPPQWCAALPRPSPDLLRRNLCMTPHAPLLEHEWAKHGSCMASTPERYFRVASILWNSLHWPDADRLSRQEGLTAGDFRRAFVAANPDWRAGQVGMVTSQNGWLKEVHLCYARNFMPSTCDRRSFGPADSAALRIWRGL